MKDKKEPHITIWVVIAVLVINQSVMMHQNFQAHQRLQNQISGFQENLLELSRRDVEQLEFLNDLLEILNHPANIPESHPSFH